MTAKIDMQFLKTSVPVSQSNISFNFTSEFLLSTLPSFSFPEWLCKALSLLTLKFCTFAVEGNNNAKCSWLNCSCPRVVNAGCVRVCIIGLRVATRTKLVKLMANFCYTRAYLLALGEPLNNVFRFSTSSVKTSLNCIYMLLQSNFGLVSSRLSPI